MLYVKRKTMIFFLVGLILPKIISDVAKPMCIFLKKAATKMG